MPVAKKVLAKKNAPKSRAQNPAQEPNAVDLLKADHKAVKKLFKQFTKLKDNDGSADDKAAVVEQVCCELKVHAQVEEEIFYPAVRSAIDDDDLMDEAEVEHDGAKWLIAQLEGMKSEDPLYDAKVTVLGEQIDHHVEEEEGEMFRKARRAKVDLEGLGAEMMRRKQELTGSAENSSPSANSRTPSKRHGDSRHSANA